MSGRRKFTIWLAILAGVIVAARLNMFRRFDRPVRCREGHLFTTIWVPLASLKAVRLGGRRVQRCPVGGHWSVVVPLDRESASDSDLRIAAAVHDMRVP